jgi:hypothetical protein
MGVDGQENFVDIVELEERPALKREFSPLSGFVFRNE